MNILGLLWTNLRNGVMTLRFPARPEVKRGFRGLVRFDPSRCTGCAMCRFRCTARAITFEATGKTFTWSYDPAHCTFCGRCVDGCKTHALSQESSCPPVYLMPGSLKRTYRLERKPPTSKAAGSDGSTGSRAGGTI